MPAADRDTEPRAIHLQGQRVTLRLMSEEDLPAVESWYPEAPGASMGLSRQNAPGAQNLYFQMEAAQADPNAGLLIIARRDDPAPIGLLDYRVGQPGDGWLTIAFIAVATGRRGWGYGSEAVRLLEEYAAGGGQAERFRADVDVRNGLGLYFWLRLGYRPAASEDIFWPSRPGGGIISMIRTNS